MPCFTNFISGVLGKFHLSIILSNSCGHVGLSCLLTVVSPSAVCQAPHLMYIATCFLLSFSSSETFLLHLASPTMSFSTPSIQEPLQDVLLQGALFLHLSQKCYKKFEEKWLQVCILKGLLSSVFTCSEGYFWCVLPSCLPSFPFLWMFQRLSK